MTRTQRSQAYFDKWLYFIFFLGCAYCGPRNLCVSAERDTTPDAAASRPQQKLYADVTTLAEALEVLKTYLNEHNASEYKHLFSEDSVKAGVRNTMTATTERARLQLRNAKDTATIDKLQRRINYINKHVEPECRSVSMGRWPKGAYFYCMPPNPKFSTLTVNLMIDHGNKDLGKYKIGGVKPSGYGVNVFTLNYGLEPRIDGPITVDVIVD